MQLKFLNVNDAFYELVKGIHNGDIPTVRTTSRVGDVLQVQEPMTITYQRPRQRVLFNPARDANPFFHLYESLWLLAGRNDVAPLAFYSSKIKDIASDDGHTFNGAYGYRWRKAQTSPDDDYDPWVITDQIQTLIEHLRAKPDSRRAVLQMWNVEDDLLKIDVVKDVCCNTCVYFFIRREPGFSDNGVQEQEWISCLDMTVCNRSNDLVLGMLGANVVHFSFLQEYMANCLGIEVGHYHQFTNNLHVYTNNFKPEEWLGAYKHKTPPEGWQLEEGDRDTPLDALQYPGWGPDLVKDQGVFDYECDAFVNSHYGKGDMYTYDYPGYREPFLAKVAWPMVMAWHASKAKRKAQALAEWVPRIESPDWQKAAREWIERRLMPEGVPNDSVSSEG